MKKSFVLLALFVFLSVLLISGCQIQDSGNESITVCMHQGTDSKMTLDEAKSIALASECNQGILKEETATCNQYTGTWWIDLDIEQQGCSPACVIGVATRNASINWRCTGLIPE